MRLPCLGGQRLPKLSLFACLLPKLARRFTVEQHRCTAVCKGGTDGSVLPLSAFVPLSRAPVCCCPAALVARRPLTQSSLTKAPWA